MLHCSVFRQTTTTRHSQSSLHSITHQRSTRCGGIPKMSTTTAWPPAARLRISSIPLATFGDVSPMNYPVWRLGVASTSSVLQRVTNARALLFLNLLTHGTSSAFMWANAETTRELSQSDMRHAPRRCMLIGRRCSAPRNCRRYAWPDAPDRVRFCLKGSGCRPVTYRPPMTMRRCRWSASIGRC